MPIAPTLPPSPEPPSSFTVRYAQLGARGELALIAAVLAVASVARFYHLGFDHLWLDEAISYVRSQLSAADIVHDCVRRKHLPTYFLLLKAWLTVGDSETLMRVPSAVFGIATAGLAYFLGRILGGPGAGFGCGLLVAIARLQIRYGQEARMYTMLSMWATLVLCALCWLVAQGPRAATSVAVLARAGSQPEPEQSKLRAVRRAWLTLSFGTALCLYTHNSAVFLVSAINLAAFAWWVLAPGYRFALARNWVLAQALALLCWSFWVPNFIFQVGTFEQRWGRAALTSETVSGVVSQVLLAFAPTPWVSAALVLAALSGLWALRDRPALCVVVLLCVVAGPLACIVASLHKNMFLPRILLWTAIPWCALLAVGVAQLPKILAPLGLAALVVIFALPLPDYYLKHHKPDWPAILTYMHAQTTPESLVFSIRASRFETYYYERKDNPLPRVASVSLQCEHVTDCLEGHNDFWILGYPSGGLSAFEADVRHSGCCDVIKERHIRKAVAIHYRVRADVERRRDGPKRRRHPAIPEGTDDET